MVKLAEIQDTIDYLEKKLERYKKDFSYAVYEIRSMEITLEELNELKNDVANMEE